MKKFVVLLSVVTIIMGLVVTVPAFAGQTDNVLSENIKEADGITGQDTNAGSGVKTGHIQDGAVTTPKVADGAVTDVKITGPISASKISSTGLDADTVDGLHASDLAPVVHTHDQTDVNGLVDELNSKSDITHNHDGTYSPTSHDHDGIYQKHYNNVIVVSVDGNGDFTSPLDAINSITDATDVNPYLIKIMPGVYEIPFSQFFAKNYVDIEGSGREVTKIISYNNCCTGPPETLLYVNVDHTELRDITVEMNGIGKPGSSSGITIVGSSPRFTNVDVNVFGGGAGLDIHANTIAVFTNVNVYVDGGGLTRHVNGVNTSGDAISYFNGGKITLTGGTDRPRGIVASSASVQLRDTEIINLQTYAMGMICTKMTTYGPSEVKIYNGRIQGDVNYIYDGCTVYGAGVQWESVPTEIGSGVFKCINCFDSNFDPLP